MKFSINASMHYFFSYVRQAPHLLEHSYVRRKVVNRIISPAFFLVQILSYKNKFCMFLPFSHFFSSSLPQSTTKTLLIIITQRFRRSSVSVNQALLGIFMFLLKYLGLLSARLGLLPIYDQKKTKKTPTYRSQDKSLRIQGLKKDNHENY